MGASVNFDGDKLLGWITDRWGRWSSLFLVEFVSVVGMVIWMTDGAISTITLPQGLLVVFCAIFLWIFWHVTVRVPKNGRGKIGIAIAIFAENKKQQDMIDKDFIQVFKETLDRSESRNLFNIVEIPSHHSRRIHVIEQADSYRRVSRCHMIIFGHTRKRTEQGKEVIKVQLRCQIVHREIKAEISRAFSKDISEIFPGRLNVDSENECQVLELTSKWLGLSARYIVGTAALLSGDTNLAQSIFEPMYDDLRKKKSPILAIKNIKQRLPTRLVDIYNSQLNLIHRQWDRNHDASVLEQSKIPLEKMQRVDPGNYSAKLTRAINYFVLDRNVPKAMSEVVACRNLRDVSWRYSYAFLLAYTGRLKDAKAAYERAFERTGDKSIPLQCEMFITWVLEQEPEKVQLHYCLGLINWHGKGDLPQAASDMQKFLDLASDTDFPEMKRIAQANAETIKGELKGVGRAVALREPIGIG